MLTDSEDACDRCDHSTNNLEQTLDGEAICAQYRDQAHGRSASQTADQRGLGEWSF
jgi:hypothetical protein